ncbi:pentaheme c-type cytochrome TorC [Thauera sp.]|uniref:pentaheme c-type cytochrome TorC n=1 Tax=Thauera sp. TaxID=1905334 RepID=UPI001B5CFB9E|nr:pentaheme c-type cytochrome TorC [Thauera sp.]MBP6132187.1 pentaheme c-type cytochrome TorC [Thauera sp.]MBP7048466.1 pentaheme c-type cytochrome TorC [Thauera sp.]
MKNLLRSLRDLFLKPSVRIGLGVLVTGGFIAGVLAWQGFNTAMEATNKEEFCLSCHTMHDNLLPELQKTVHWNNRSGVRARCPDCHVPHDFTDKVARKMQASREVLGQLLGTIDTREKFKEHRIVLAQREWKRFAANGSKECRACHDYKDMNFDKMRPASQVAMRKAAERNQSCVDCHKGVAHQLPEMKGARNPAFDTLVSSASGQSVATGKDYFLVVPQELFADEGLSKRIGSVEVATQVKVLETKGDAQRVEFALWRKNKGYGRVWYSHFGLNITSATFDKDVAQDTSFVKVLDTREDPMTGLEWQQVTATAWMRKGSVLDSVEPVWSIARASYSSSCSVCHRQPDEAHFDVNTWPGLFGGMVGFTSMDDDTARVVLKYLQTHSSDFSKSHGAGSPDAALQTARP